MQLYRLLQAVLIAGAVLARKDLRQVIVTVTAGVTPSSPAGPTAPAPIPLSAAPVPWEQSTILPVPVSKQTTSPALASSSTKSAALSLPPSPPSSPSTASIASLTSAVSATATGSGSVSGGAKCGKGYTYCGYMLAGGGHNFEQTEIDKSYCDGLPELCAGGVHKTDIGQAVFVCMSDQPSTIQLMCACSGTCQNNASSNYIAHCNKACIND
ncbi:hypothetical protein HD806DRAFT_145313 [Xylariaceae sp. AK1471]|nr:hypothetical protein HD806DRAFT_145313 [Xylariaceae sp. AK1471]